MIVASGWALQGDIAVKPQPPPHTWGVFRVTFGGPRLFFRGWGYVELGVNANVDVVIQKKENFPLISVLLFP
jgi:hypothetical protein